jgi:hypothetical protein
MDAKDTAEGRLLDGLNRANLNEASDFGDLGCHRLGANVYFSDLGL